MRSRIGVLSANLPCQLHCPLTTYLKSTTRLFPAILLEQHCADQSRADQDGCLLRQQAMALCLGAARMPDTRLRNRASPKMHDDKPNCCAPGSDPKADDFDARFEDAASEVPEAPPDIRSALRDRLESIEGGFFDMGARRSSFPDDLDTPAAASGCRRFALRPTPSPTSDMPASSRLPDTARSPSGRDGAMSFTCFSTTW